MSKVLAPGQESGHREEHNQAIHEWEEDVDKSLDEGLETETDMDDDAMTSYHWPHYFLLGVCSPE